MDRLDCITPRQIRDGALEFDDAATPALAAQVQVQARAERLNCVMVERIRKTI